MDDNEKDGKSKENRNETAQYTEPQTWEQVDRREEKIKTTAV